LAHISTKKSLEALRDAPITKKSDKKTRPKSKILQGVLWQLSFPSQKKYPKGYFFLDGKESCYKTFWKILLLGRVCLSDFLVIGASRSASRLFLVDICAKKAL
jgi:hypothetical protein